MSVWKVKKMNKQVNEFLLQRESKALEIYACMIDCPCKESEQNRELSEEFRNVRQYINQLELENEWNTNLASMPKDGTEILVFSTDRPKGKGCCVVWWDGKGWAFSVCKSVLGSITLYLGDEIVAWKHLVEPKL